MSIDLEVDPPESLRVNMLLHNSNGNPNNNSSEESDSDVVEDWSRYGSLNWSDSHNTAMGKPFADFMDVSDLSTGPMLDMGMGMGMDYSFSTSMGIDPASLHFNGLDVPGVGYPDSTAFMDPYAYASAGVAFTHQPQSLLPPLSTQDSTSPQPFPKERRLSVTSSSSSSGASLSPVPDNFIASSPTSRSGYSSDSVSTKEETNGTANLATTHRYLDDPTTELAHHVRQAAGVMLAVPVNGFGTNPPVGTNMSGAKIPIPRLNRPSTSSFAKSATATAPPSSASSAASTPPSTPPSTSHSPLNVTAHNRSVNAPSSTNGPPMRPKTSHTTIERRYRTNLNARIQSLRMAVPALRVLEDRDGSHGKKIKKEIKGGVLVKGGGIGIGVDAEDGSVVDVIDERGFVDGVKVARKCSKANVLGKAVEYIKVLKRRERRLKAELAGVKVLVEGLVGGPALIGEWEKQWRGRFGGEEKDEIESEGADGDGEVDDDDSEDDDGEEEDDDGVGRKRKRAKVSGGIPKKVENNKKKPVPPPVAVVGGEPVPEKRKRGRPRKILPPPVTIEPAAPILPAVTGQWQQPPPQQFLLAVFALFSFFNSSSSSYPSQHHHHTGQVLTPIHPPLAYSPEIVSQFVQPSSSVVSGPAWKEYVQLFHLAVSFLVFASFVANWLGFSVSGFRFSFEKRELGWGLNRKGKGGDEKAENDCWIKFAEKSVLSRETSSLTHFQRLQIYRTISARKDTSVSGLASAAIALNSSNGVILGGLARMKAKKIWDDVLRKVQANVRKVNVKEELVFGTLDLAGASARLALVKDDDLTDGEREYDVIEVLASSVVKERLTGHLGRIFVEMVGKHEDESEATDEEMNDAAEEERRRRKTVDASRELGGIIEDVGRLFERIWKLGVGGVDLKDLESVFADIPVEVVDEEIEALLVAIVLYSRLFGDVSSECSDTETERGVVSPDILIASSIISPPSPRTEMMTTRRTSKFRKSGMNDGMLELRGILGCRVFEGVVEKGEKGVECDVGVGVEGLEEAKDRVVDMIIDFERRNRC